MKLQLERSTAQMFTAGESESDCLPSTAGSASYYLHKPSEHHNATYLTEVKRYRCVKHLAVLCHEMYLLSEYQIYNYYYYNRQRIKTLSNSENDVIGCPKCLAPNMSAPLLTQPQFELQTAPSHFSLNILLHFIHPSGIDFS